MASASSSFKSEKNDNDDILSDQELVRRESTEAYKAVIRLNESCIKKDWRQYAKLLSDEEIKYGVMEHEKTTKAVVSMDAYREDVIPRQMNADRGVYNNLIDYEMYVI